MLPVSDNIYEYRQSYTVADCGSRVLTTRNLKAANSGGSRALNIFDSHTAWPTCNPFVEGLPWERPNHSVTTALPARMHRSRIGEQASADDRASAYRCSFGIKTIVSAIEKQATRKPWTPPLFDGYSSSLKLTKPMNLEHFQEALLRCLVVHDGAFIQQVRRKIFLQLQ